MQILILGFCFALYCDFTSVLEKVLHFCFCGAGNSLVLEQ